MNGAAVLVSLRAGALIESCRRPVFCVEAQERILFRCPENGHKDVILMAYVCIIKQFSCRMSKPGLQPVIRFLNAIGASSESTRV